MEKINFENYPSTNSPINATNLNLLQDNIEDDIMNVKNSIGNLEDDELKNYMISNSVPSQAVNLFHISLSGAGKGLMIQKTNNLYLSFILWGYSGDCTLYRYVNGTWYEKDL